MAYTPTTPGPPSSTIGDPFLSVESDVRTLLSQTRPLLQSYESLRTLAPASPFNVQHTQDLATARSDLENNIRDLASDLQELTDTVQVVEPDPARYGLSVVEVRRRKEFVRDVGQELEGMRQSIAAVASRARAQSSAAAGKPPFAPPDPDGDTYDPENDTDFAAYEQQRQLEIMEEQDEQLDSVFRTVGNIREQADIMGRELEEQGELLDTVHTDTDRVDSKLQDGMRRMGKILRDGEDRWSGCCIAVLIFVLILLLVLLLVL